MDDKNIAGQVAVVTGAASGIGAACALALAKAGATVVGVDVDDGNGRALFEKLGAGHCYEHLDVADPSAWEQLLQTVVARYGKVDILHLNAGVMSRPRGQPILDAPLDWFTLPAYLKVRSVNLDGVVFGVIAALKLQTVRRLVLTASGAAITPLPLDPFYTATKYALLGLGLALAPSLAERGMRIDVLCPGAVETPITAPDVKAAFKQESPDFIAAALIQILAADSAPNNAWIANTAEEGLLPYSAGAQSALDLIESVER